MKPGEKYLISTDNFFYGPDGVQYNAAWGSVRIEQDNVLGVKTNARSANWFAIVGDGPGEVFIAGCQIHYAVLCPNSPNFDKVTLTYMEKSEPYRDQNVMRMYNAHEYYRPADD